MSLFNIFGEKEIKQIPNKTFRELTNEEASFLADYFHNQECCPDYDGYVGHYFLPEKVMIEYRKKYGEQRGW